MSHPKHEILKISDTRIKYFKSFRHSLANRLMPLFMEGIEPSLLASIDFWIKAIDILDCDIDMQVYEIEGKKYLINQNFYSFIISNYNPTIKVLDNCITFEFRNLHNKIADNINNQFPENFEIDILFTILKKFNVTYSAIGIFHMEAYLYEK